MVNGGGGIMRIFLQFLCTLGAAIYASAAPAQITPVDTPPIEVLPDYINRRITADEPEQAFSNLARTRGVERGVIVGAKRWDSGVPIRVCFFGGSRELRRSIVAVASGWEQQGAPVSFDFGDRADPALCRSNQRFDIRIGYTQLGYWSMIGQDSLVHVGQLEQSMNFQRFDISPPAAEEFRRVVLHEFGHALGFYHEHQQAEQGCENDFNWPVVYQYLAGPPNRWSKETIDFNLRSRRYMSGDIQTNFNVKSIMLYTFPIEFYNNGDRNRCYSSGNSSISGGDAQLLRNAYGKAGISRLTSAAAITAAAASYPAPERAALNTRLTLFKANEAAKNQILRIGNVKFTDVDIKACSSSPATLQSVESVTQFLNSEPKIGMLRYRGIAVGSTDTQGVTVFADFDHPEITDARRISASLSSRFGKPAKLTESAGRDRWLLTVVVCGAVGAS